MKRLWYDYWLAVTVRAALMKGEKVEGWPGFFAGLRFIFFGGTMRLADGRRIRLTRAEWVEGATDGEVARATVEGLEG